MVPGLGSYLAYDPSRRLLLAAVSVGARADSPAAGTASRWAAVDLGGQVRPERTAMPPPFQIAQAAGGGPIAVLTTGNNLVITGQAGANLGDPIPLGAVATALAVSPGGTRVAVATDDSRITVFDTVSRRAVYAVPATRRSAHLTYVGALAWDPAGRRVAASVGSLDDGLFVPQAVATVTADPQAWATRLCQVFRPGLTTTEWRRYAGPGLPYLDPCEVG